MNKKVWRKNNVYGNKNQNEENEFMARKIVEWAEKWTENILMDVDKATY
jgi:hypothetical protein